jgi:D-aminopeptidase
VSQQLIQQGAQQAVQRLAMKEAVRPYVVKEPVHLVVEFQSSDMADRAGLFPGTSRDGLRQGYTAANMLEAYSAFRTIVSLAYPR